MQAANRPVFAKGEEVQLKRIATILESRPLALVEISRITMCEVNLSRKWHESVGEIFGKLQESRGEEASCKRG